MRNIIKLLGVIAFIAIIGFSMTSCNDEPEIGIGAIQVVHNSSMEFDTKPQGVTISLYQDDDYVDSKGGIKSGEIATFYPVDEGSGYRILVTDANPNPAKATFASDPFNLEKDARLSFKYTGTKIILTN